MFIHTDARAVSKLMKACAFLCTFLGFTALSYSKNYANSFDLPWVEIRPFYQSKGGLTLIELIPVNEASACGYQSLVLEEAYAYEGIDQISLYTSNSILNWNGTYLQDKSHGIYTLYQSESAPRTPPKDEHQQVVALGYKCNWVSHSNTQILGSNNSVVNVAVVNTNGAIRSKSSNVIPPNGDAWLAFELIEPIVTNDAVYSNDYFTIALENANGEGMLLAFTPVFDPTQSGGTHLGKASYNVSVKEVSSNGSASAVVASATAEIGEKVLIKKDNSSHFSVRIGDQDVLFSGNTSYAYQHAAVEYVQFRSYSHDYFQMGVKHAIVSFACPLINYFQLTDKVSSNYCVVINNELWFKYDERYNYSGQLNYAVFDEYHQEKTGFTNTQISPNTVKFGENWMRLDVSSLSNGNYLLEVTDSKNTTKYLRFKIVQ